MKKNDQENNQASGGKSTFLFSLEVLIDAETNGKAMERLLHALNENHFPDYRILKGIELGKVIEQAIFASTSEDGDKTGKPETKIEKEIKPHTAVDQAIIDQIQVYKEKGALIRLFILKGKGVRLNLPCRILNVDVDSNTISVYHVDEKKTYLFKLNEIDDIVENP